MINEVHTFLHFLADNLPNHTVRPIRNNPADPSSNVLQVGAINVTFLDHHFATGESSSRVVLDVLFESEAEQFSVLSTVSNLLRMSYYTPTLSYAIPSNPVPVGGNVTWDRDDVTFSRVAVDNYCHHVCVLTLRYA